MQVHVRGEFLLLVPPVRTPAAVLGIAEVEAELRRQERGVLRDVPALVRGFELGKPGRRLVRAARHDAREEARMARIDSERKRTTARGRGHSDDEVTRRMALSFAPRQAGSCIVTPGSADWGYPYVMHRTCRSPRLRHAPRLCRHFRSWSRRPGRKCYGFVDRALCRGRRGGTASDPPMRKPGGNPPGRACVMLPGQLVAVRGIEPRFDG